MAFLGYDPFCEKPETIAQHIGAVRRCKGWSLEKLANQLEVDPGALSRWESGRTPYRSIADRIGSQLRALLDTAA
jgi:transcriptional regulator with XRE-family HTH domain